MPLEEPGTGFSVEGFWEGGFSGFLLWGLTYQYGKAPEMHRSRQLTFFGAGMVSAAALRTSELQAIKCAFPGTTRSVRSRELKKKPVRKESEWTKSESDRLLFIYILFVVHYPTR